MKKMRSALSAGVALCLFAVTFTGCNGGRRASEPSLSFSSSDVSSESADTSSAGMSATKIYTVRFLTNGGSEIADRQAEEGSILELDGIETERENARFCGWYLDEGLIERAEEKILIVGDLALYARWSELFSIGFDCRGGGETESIVGEAGEAVFPPEAPVKEGYVFEGWYRDEACTALYEFTYMPSENITLYAKWRERQKDVEIRLHINSPVSSGDVLTPVTADEGSEGSFGLVAEGFERITASLLVGKVSCKAEELKSDPVYHIVGWAYDEEGLDAFDGTIPHAPCGVDLYAVWARSPKYCKVSFVGLDETEPPFEYFVVKGTAIPDSAVSEREDAYEAEGFYTFEGVRYAGEPIERDMTLYARPSVSR